MKNVIILLARILLSAIFLGAAFNKITDFKGTLQMMTGGQILEAFDKPVLTALLIGAIVFLVVGGLSVLAGRMTTLGVSLLGVFLVLATVAFHMRPGEEIGLMKNLAILGGLLLLAVQGPGSLSLDGRRLKDRS